MTAKEHDVEAGGITLRVREAGDLGGESVIHFHGTPGCRLELAFADDIVEASGVHIIAFDRPGYGGSTQTPFSLTSVAKMAVQVADRLGVDQFRTTGWSGGGPFALATAALAGARVQAVGVIAGAGPFQLVPGVLDELSDGDKVAEKLLPGNQRAACEGFVEGFDLKPALENATSLYQAFKRKLSESDRQVWAVHSEHLLADVREAMTREFGAAAGTTSLGLVRGTSTQRSWSAQSCCGTEPRTAWPRRRTPTGSRRICPTLDSPCTKARAIYSPSYIWGRCLRSCSQAEHNL